MNPVENKINDVERDCYVEGDSFEYDSDSSSNSRIIIEEELPYDHGSNCLHIITLGGETYMAQLWIENKKFQIRVVTDSNSNAEPPGILAKAEINLELKPGWSQVMFSVEEQNSALKNHLAFRVCKCLIRYDVFWLSFNLGCRSN